MKSQMVKTTSFYLDTKNIDFGMLQQKLKFVRYDFPDCVRFGGNKNDYAKLHNWVKQNFDDPYYFNNPNKSIYTIIHKDVNIQEVCWDSNKLKKQELNPAESQENTINCFKALISLYTMFGLNRVANEKIFVDTGDKNADFKTVLALTILHNWKNRNRDLLEFNLIDEATTMRRIKSDKLNVSYDIPYQLSYTKDNNLIIYKQLKPNAIKSEGNIFVRYSNSDYRSKLAFHSLKNWQKNEKSRLGILNKFYIGFKDFLAQYGITLIQKEIRMEQIDTQKETFISLPNTNQFKPVLIDGRIKKENQPFTEIVNQLQKELNDSNQTYQLTEKTKDQLEPGESALFVIDHAIGDFGIGKVLENELDTYASFKKDPEMYLYPKQGLCINPNPELQNKTEIKKRADQEIEPLYSDKNGYFNYSNLSENKNILERNFPIAVQQLYLKSLVQYPKDILQRIPFANWFKDKVVLVKQFKQFLVLYFEKNTLQIKSFKDDLAEFNDEIGGIIKNKTKRELIDVFKKWAEYNSFSQKLNANSIKNFQLIISPEFIWQIENVDERFFYDVEKQQSLLKEMSKKRKRKAFLAIEAEHTSAKDKMLIRNYNDFVQTHVNEVEINFNRLKNKYGKSLNGNKEDGFFNKVFGKKRESTSIIDFFEKYCGLKLYGVKSTLNDPTLKLHKGIWFDPDSQQYFVGRLDSYQGYEQDKGYQMRKVITLEGKFFPDDFFQLMKIDFIRHKGITVRPFVFKLIDMFADIEKEKNGRDN